MHQVCRYLSEDAVTVSLRGVSDSDRDWPLPPNPLNLWIRHIVSHRRKTWYKLSDLWAELGAVRACRSNRLDIVHYLDAEHTAQYLPRWIRRSGTSRVKTVATFHQPPELLAGLTRPATIASLDFVLVVSPAQEPFFRQFLPADRVRTLLYGVDADFFHPARTVSAQRPFRCITVGHWMRDWKAARAVVDILSGSNIEFHVVTNRETGLDGLANVRMHRNVDDEALRRLYQESDVLFLPLTNATANNSLLEGLACGLPAVSTELLSVRAYVGEGAASLIENNDPEALAQAIVNLQKNGELRERMSRNARARAEKLSWPRVAPLLEQVYFSLVNGNSGRV
jgi:glycosyltransferase involved in cell wall biosynthesis